MGLIERNVEVYDQDDNWLSVREVKTKPGGALVVTVEVEAAPSADNRGAVAALRDLADEVEFAFPASVDRRGLRQALDRAHSITGGQ